MGVNRHRLSAGRHLGAGRLVRIIQESPIYRNLCLTGNCNIPTCKHDIPECCEPNVPPYTSGNSSLRDYYGATDTYELTDGGHQINVFGVGSINLIVPSHSQIFSENKSALNDSAKSSHSPVFNIASNLGYARYHSSASINDPFPSASYSQVKKIIGTTPAMSMGTSSPMLDSINTRNNSGGIDFTFDNQNIDLVIPSKLIKETDPRFVGKKQDRNEQSVFIGADDSVVFVNELSDLNFTADYDGDSVTQRSFGPDDPDDPSDCSSSSCYSNCKTCPKSLGIDCCNACDLSTIERAKCCCCDFNFGGCPKTDGPSCDTCKNSKSGEQVGCADLEVSYGDSSWCELCCNTLSSLCDDVICPSCQTCKDGVCEDNCTSCQTCEKGVCVDNCPSCQTCIDGECVDKNCDTCYYCVADECVLVQCDNGAGFVDFDVGTGFPLASTVGPDSCCSCSNDTDCDPSQHRCCPTDGTKNCVVCDDCADILSYTQSGSDVVSMRGNYAQRDLVSVVFLSHDINQGLSSEFVASSNDNIISCIAELTIAQVYGKLAYTGAKPYVKTTKFNVHRILHTDFDPETATCNLRNASTSWTTENARNATDRSEASSSFTLGTGVKAGDKVYVNLTNIARDAARNGDGVIRFMIEPDGFYASSTGLGVNSEVSEHPSMLLEFYSSGTNGPRVVTDIKQNLRPVTSRLNPAVARYRAAYSV